MKYQGMPAGMWLLFGGSFRKNLVEVLGFGRKEAGMITSAAKRKYREIIDALIAKKNDLIATGHYTDAIDEILIKLSRAKQKKVKVIYTA